ncbi:hypothetical protein CROQUDRAFT_38804, partial [Cronartium quercuum f. sp. fusiforme G11]
APYHSVGIYAQPPAGCRATCVVQLQRHGARYPTAHVGRKIEQALAKLHAAGELLDKTFEFVNRYRYTLRTDNLLPFGAQESLYAGAEFRKRYIELVEGPTEPFVRASASQRVIDSASNFTAGLGVRVPVLTISEPLDDHSCPNAPEMGYASQWLSAFAGPVADRLNGKARALALTTTDVISLMQLCYFESLATGRLSEFCGIFLSSEWVGYGNTGSSSILLLNRLYKHGHGNRLGPVQGVGYVAELLSRLTRNRTHVNVDRTQVNHTLDQSSESFPLDRAIYLDFSHDNQMISIITAMGLKRAEPLLSAEVPPRPQREWRISSIVPFAGRMTVEKLTCDQMRGEQVRVFLNDAQVRMPMCEDRLEGMCTLEDFVNSQRFVIENGNGLYDLVCTTL